MIVETVTDLIIQSVTPSGVSFGITLGHAPATVVIPPKVAGPRMLAPWQVFRAVVGPNPRQDSNVQWLCHRLLGEPKPGQPYSGDTFVERLATSSLPAEEVCLALAAWQRGDFPEAVRYFGEIIAPLPGGQL